MSDEEAKGELYEDLVNMSLEHSSPLSDRKTKFVREFPVEEIYYELSFSERGRLKEMLYG